MLVYHDAYRTVTSLVVLVTLGGSNNDTVFARWRHLEEKPGNLTGKNITISELLALAQGRPQCMTSLLVMVFWSSTLV